MTSNQDRAATLVKALRAGIEGDHPTIRLVCTDDVRAWTPSTSTSSLSELLVELDRRDDAFDAIELDVVELDVGGSYACVEWTVGMTHSGTISLAGQTIEPTGLRVTLHGVTVGEFDGERICSLRQYWDEFAVLEQLGVMTRPDHEGASHERAGSG